MTDIWRCKGQPSRTSQELDEDVKCCPDTVNFFAVLFLEMVWIWVRSWWGRAKKNILVKLKWQNFGDWNLYKYMAHTGTGLPLTTDTVWYSIIMYFWFGLRAVRPFFFWPAGCEVIWPDMDNSSCGFSNSKSIGPVTWPSSQMGATSVADDQRRRGGVRKWRKSCLGRPLGCLGSQSQTVKPFEQICWGSDRHWPQFPANCSLWRRSLAQSQCFPEHSQWPRNQLTLPARIQMRNIWVCLKIGYIPNEIAI